MINNSISYIFFFFLSFRFLLSQPSLEWVNLYPDKTAPFGAGASYIAVDDSDNVFISGNAGTGRWSAYFTIKYNSSGIQQWVSFYYGDSSGGRFPKAIVLDDSSNVYITGYSYINGDYFDFCTIKYNTIGVQQWVQFYDGPAHGIDQATAITIDKTRNIYVTGFSTRNSTDDDYATIKYSSTGTQIWVMRYIGYHQSTIPTSVITDDSCNVYITGCNNNNTVTVKYDSSGNQIWDRTYYGYNGRSIANSIILDNYNNVIIAGQDGYDYSSDYFIIKYSIGGMQQWVERYNYDSNNINSYDRAISLASDKSGNMYVTGEAGYSDGSNPSRLCSLKYTNDGNLIWVKIDTDNILGGGRRAFINVDLNYFVYIGCVFDSISPFGSFNIMKYDSSGNTLWNEKYMDHNAEEMDLAISKNFENIYISGNRWDYAQHGQIITLKYSQIYGIQKENNNIISEYKLFQNYPNPFNSISIIKYKISKLTKVRLVIYNIIGQQIKKLVDKIQNKGEYQINFDGSNLPSGIYFYILSCENEIQTKKMILIR